MKINRETFPETTQLTTTFTLVCDKNQSDFAGKTDESRGQNDDKRVGSERHKNRRGIDYEKVSDVILNGLINRLELYWCSNIYCQP